MLILRFQLVEFKGYIMGIMLIAYKCGMTRFFTQAGLSIPVTIVKVYSNYVVGLRPINDDFCLVKLSAGIVKKNKLKKSVSGFYKSIGVSDFKYMLEFKVKKSKSSDYVIGSKFSVSTLNISDKVNVIGTSKGKGFSGVIKRHNFSAQRATHGNSLSHRAPGSIGQCQTPGKVFKGKKMSGQMGNSRVTVSNVEVLGIYNDLEAVVLKGSIPGAPGNKIILKKSFHKI